jgi:hypothetical protein
MLGLSSFRYQEFSLSGFAMESAVLLTTPTHHTECEVCGVCAQTSASALVKICYMWAGVHSGYVSC